MSEFNLCLSFTKNEICIKSFQQDNESKYLKVYETFIMK